MSTRDGFNLLALQFGFIVMFAVAWELGPLLMILTNIFQAGSNKQHNEANPPNDEPDPDQEPAPDVHAGNM